MRLLITTKSGSLYEIDPDNKTWSRREKTPQSGHIRGDEYGSYLEIAAITVGYPLTLILEPYETGGPGRMILTSDVVEVILP